MKKTYELDANDMKEALRMYISTLDSSILDRESLKVELNCKPDPETGSGQNFSATVREK